MCEHLIQLEQELIQQKIKETFRGQAWSDNCREWVYYDCYFDIEKVRKRFSLPDFVKHYYNDDIKSGLEEGFICEKCKDAIIGLNSRFRAENKKIIFR